MITATMKPTDTIAKIESELDRLLSVIPSRVKKNDTRIRGRMHQLRAAVTALKEIIDPGQARHDRRRASHHDTSADFYFGSQSFDPAY